MRKSPLIFPDIISILSVVVAQYTLGKKAAFPLGMVLGISAYEIAVIVVICEFGLIVFIHCLFTLSLGRFRWTQFLSDHFDRIQIHLKEGKWTSRFLKIGWFGPLFITAVPFSGGVWTGMALSKVMNLPNKQTLWSVSVGAVIGCAIFLLAALGILTIVDFPQA